MRPEGFNNPYPKSGTAQPENIPWLLIHDIYEAGADEYERCIWKAAKESPTGTFTFDTHIIEYGPVTNRRINERID